MRCGAGRDEDEIFSNELGGKFVKYKKRKPLSVATPNGLHRVLLETLSQDNRGVKRSQEEFYV